jgi:hypothetical protein
MDWRLQTVAGVSALAGLFALAAPAWADDGKDLAREVEALQRRVGELENSAPTQDEINATVSRYLGSAPAAVMVGGGADGSAGFPLGKKPFIKEGPNKLEIQMRMQVRYSSFLYSKDAVGVIGNGATPEVLTLSDAAPRDRSGFELERMYIGFEGTFCCEDITYKLELNFDTDSGNGIEKNYAYIDWKYTGEHHIRAGSDKTAYTYEENNSSSALAFVDRSILTKAFECGFNTGVSFWGYFGDCDCPKRFMYKLQAGNGEGRQSQEGGSTALGSPFNRDARDTFSDHLQYAGLFEYNLTCCTGDYKWDEVDHRPCDKRCEWQAAVGASFNYENDDDFQHAAWGGLVMRNANQRANRYGYDAWFRSQYLGWSFLAEYMLRNIDYTELASGAKSTSPTQEDSGVAALIHYRFGESNWGIGVRGSLIWIDKDYRSVTVPTNPAVALKDTISEYGVVVNYFFYDHNNKLQLDVNWVKDNSGVNSSSAGYMNGNARGVVIEDGIMLRIQWMINF